MTNAKKIQYAIGVVLGTTKYARVEVYAILNSENVFSVSTKGKDGWDIGTLFTDLDAAKAAAVTHSKLKAALVERFGE